MTSPTSFWCIPAARWRSTRRSGIPAAIVEEAGIGIRNFWTFLNAAPLTAQKDMILNAPQPISSLHPIHMDADRQLGHRHDLGPPDAGRPERRGRCPGPPNPSLGWIRRTLEVTLRDGMEFHDGQPVTAEDVQYSFEVPGDQGEGAAVLSERRQYRQRRRSPARTTLRFTLKAPQSSFFISTLCKIAIIPKHVWKPIMDSLEGTSQTVEDYREEKRIGSGPFRFVHWRDPEEVMLERNDRHWMPPKLDRWILRTVPNQEATLGMLRNGEINFLAIFTGDPQNVAALAQQEPNIHVVTTTDLGIQFIAMNHRRPPFNDTAFRRRAVDRGQPPDHGGCGVERICRTAGSCVSAGAAVLA